MSITLDACALAANDREDAIRTLIWDRVVRVEIAHQPDPSRIEARGRISDLGPLNVCSIRSNATTVERTRPLAHDPVDPFVFVGLQVTGSSMVLQNDREATLGPGDLAVYDTRRPYTLVNEGGIHQHFFRVPVADLQLPGRVLDAVTAVRLDGDRPLARVTSGHLRQLAENAHRLSESEAAQVAGPSIALIRALLASQVSDLPQAGDYLEDCLEVRIIDFVRTHLRERDLSAARIAYEHHVSVRQLYRLLAASGITLGEWIRAQRLEECRRELADVANTSTVTAIAHRWGFSDLTYFGRAFKATYGASPSGLRASSRRPRRRTDD